MNNDILTDYYLKLKLLGIDNNTIRIKDDDIGFVLVYVDYSYPSDIFRVPNFVYKLGNSCFSGTKLRKIIINKNVIEIGENCFANCNLLDVIIVPNHLRGSLEYIKQSNNAKIVFV